MNLFELFVKIGVDDQASGKLSVLSEKLGNGIKTAAKVGLTAVTAAATGIAALTKSSVDSYAEYEQLVGGVETLFKDSADSVVKYAESAYKTAGISTNKYMETVTSFSASLLQSTGRVAQQDTAALEIELFEQYKLTKQACEDEYDELEKSWKDRIALAKKNKDENVELLIEQKDQELKALKRLNEDKLAEIEAHNAKVLKEAEEANQMSVTTAESQAKAVELANQAIIDMSDNANKMG